MDDFCWDECRTAFYVDGSLRDIYVLRTTLADWDKFLQFASTLKALYFHDGILESIPKYATGLFGKNVHASLLHIEVESLVLNCHFFCVEEIELDIDPELLTSQADLINVLCFITRLGKALAKDVALADENAPDSIWFRYDANLDELAFSDASSETIF